MFDVGDAPRYRADEPAAMPATMVPWPLSSLPAAPEVPVKSTTPWMRFPKSSQRDVSTPESTIAMPGAEGAGERGVLQRVLTPVACGQRRPDATLCPFTRPFGVIERTDGSDASDSSCEPVRFATTPRITENGTMLFPPAFLTRSLSADEDVLGCPRTITLSAESGLA